MKKVFLLLWLVLLAGGVAITSGCPPTDDDDDDATPPTEDDDDVADDDDSAEPEVDYDGLSFAVSLQVTPPGAERDEDDDDSAGDDDDSGADDDDSAGDDDDSGADDDDDDAVEPEGYEVVATFIFSYWADMTNGVGLCDQHVQIEGEALFGFGTVDDCNNCSGAVRFDPTTAVEVSNPTADPDHCTPGQFGEDDWGVILLEPASQTAFGDFLELGLMDLGTMGALGLTADVAGDMTAESLAADYAEYGLVTTHMALTNNIEGSLGSASGLDAVAANAGGASTWHFYFALFLNPETNPHDGTDMSGEYGGQGLWVITFSPQ